MRTSPTRQALARRRLVLLVLGMVCLLFIGLVYGYSMFVSSMTRDFGLEDIGPVFYVMMACFCFGNLGGSALLGRIEPRILLITAAVLFALAFCTTGLCCERFGVITLYVFYAVIGGFASGAGYTAIVGTVIPWFPDRTGLASGLLLLGFGISSLLLGNAVLTLRGTVGSIGPVFVGVGIVGAGLSLLLAMLITRAPANIAQQIAKGASAANEAPARNDASRELAGEKDGTLNVEDAEKYDPSVRFENDKVFKEPIFIVYLVAFTLVSFMGLGVIGSVAGDGVMLGLSERFASLLVGLVALSNGLIRIVLGAIIDRKGVPFTFNLEGIVGTLALLSILASFVTRLPTLYVVGALLICIIYNPVLSSAFARLRFGAKNYPMNLAIINFTVLPAAIINILLSELLGPDARFEFFLIATACVTTAMVLSFVFRALWKRDFGRVQPDQGQD